MDLEKSLLKKSFTLRHYVLVMAFVFLVGICFFGLPFAKTVLNLSSQKQPAVSEQLATSTTPAASLFDRSAPVELVIPSLNIDASFVAPLGLNADGTVSVPDSYEQVGWYKNGATPGEIGPGVILGHVDSYKGPAVFYSLGQLKKGDEIEVKRADNTTAVFIVDELVRYSQDQFPTERVYGKTDNAVLRLVTCTGIYNRGAQRYSHNLVVYASLKSNNP